MIEFVATQTMFWEAFGLGLCAFLWCLGLGIKHYLEATSGRKRDE